jgi:predicted polyphosphate/ATP-dependent NAD kinase
MRDELVYILLPGGIDASINGKLGSTNHGIDGIPAESIVASGADESMLLDIVRRQKGKVIRSVPLEHATLFKDNDGGISLHLLKEIGKASILLYATPERLASLNGSPLIVDTGSPELDEQLSGFYNVLTGPGRRAIYRAIPSTESLDPPKT